MPIAAKLHQGSCLNCLNINW